jgi:hypothetical protein
VLSTLPTPAVAAGAVSQIDAASTAALPPATIDVSPAQVQVGGVTLSMALEPARHMLAQTAVVTSDPDTAHQPAAGSPANTASIALVLDGLLRLTNNIDPSQPLPEDLPQAIVRHVNVQVRTAEGGYSVPYLSVSMDMLLDGRPVTSDLAVVPMVTPESTTPQLYYGNNLKIAQRGTYQVFIRLQPSAVLGKDQPPVAEFNVAVH